MKINCNQREHKKPEHVVAEHFFVIYSDKKKNLPSEFKGTVS
jgi:hypothetical protein